MQIDFSDGWIPALRALLAIAAFAGFSWALVSNRRQSEHDSAQLAARLETALTEIRRLSGQVIALGGAIDTLGTRITQAPAARPAPPPPTVNTRGYETAIRMARGGASIEEIVASCGTTRAEAKLLRRLHECGDARRSDAESMALT